MTSYDTTLSSFYGRPGNSRFAMGGVGPGAYVDCCAQNPDYYKVVGETANGRLIEMTVPPGIGDKAHDHPNHYLYVIDGGKLRLTPPPGVAPAGPEVMAEIELTSGMALTLPAGVHQVTNIGETVVKLLFWEPYSVCAPCEMKGFVDPLTVAPECYKEVTGDDAWKVVEINMEVGMRDPTHAHRDHVVYIVAANQLTLYNNGNDAEAMVAPVGPGACLSLPAGIHSVLNSGTVPAKIVYFEPKF